MLLSWNQFRILILVISGVKIAGQNAGLIFSNGNDGETIEIKLVDYRVLKVHECIWNRKSDEDVNCFYFYF